MVRLTAGASPRISRRLSLHRKGGNCVGGEDGSISSTGREKARSGPLEILLYSNERTLDGASHLGAIWKVRFILKGMAA
jgi:hypothetical protein